MAVSHAAVLAIILVALGGIGLLLLSRGLDRGATQDLFAAARQEADRIAESGRVTPPPDSDQPSKSATRIAVFDGSGALVGEPSETPAWLTPSTTPIRDVRVAGERVRIVTVTARREGIDLATVAAGRSLAPEERLLHQVRLLLLGGGAVAIVVSLLAGWWLAGRAAEPVERAYEAQAGFAADASHELRTPLTFIRSGVEVLAERDPELGSQVLSEVDYLTGLTSRMLALARAERGAVPLEREPVDLADACREAAHRSETASGNRLLLAGGAATALGDRIGVEAALDAVLENVAVHGGGEAVIRWRQDGASATIEIEDHGPGLPPELEERAFERFARADPSRSRSTGGAGLGLPLARALVEAQGGRMHLRPSRGGGLTATIELPAG
jgi:signal transduction histidine kinase